VDTFNVGDILDGRYEITRILGKGGMDPDFDALEVALKRRDASSDHSATHRARPLTIEVRPAAPRLW
jgi:hypothetical protein